MNKIKTCSHAYAYNKILKKGNDSSRSPFRSSILLRQYSIISALHMIFRTVAWQNQIILSKQMNQINLVLLLLTLKMSLSDGYSPWYSWLKIIRCYFIHRREIPLYSILDGDHWYSNDQLLWYITGKSTWLSGVLVTDFLNYFLLSQI